MITPAQLRSICPTLSEPRSITLCSLLNTLCPQYGMDTVDELHEFLAQVAHESGEFRLKEENMNYSEKRLTQVWPSRFPDKYSAQPYAYNPEKLANKVYANRMGNGSEQSMDGWRFRGGSYIQLTGRDMYTKYARYKKVDVATVAHLVRTDDMWAMDCSLWVYCVEKKLLDESERDEFLAITRSINGGTIGIEHRKVYYERAKAAIPEQTILSWAPGSGIG